MNVFIIQRRSFSTAFPILPSPLCMSLQEMQIHYHKTQKGLFFFREGEIMSKKQKARDIASRLLPFHYSRISDSKLNCNQTLCKYLVGYQSAMYSWRSTLQEKRSETGGGHHNRSRGLVSTRSRGGDGGSTYVSAQGCVANSRATDCRSITARQLPMVTLRL
jgi:hypothetical protein